jgi:hypothetical protein
MERREQHTQKTMCDRIDTQLFMSSRIARRQLCRGYREVTFRLASVRAMLTMIFCKSTFTAAKVPAYRFCVRRELSRHPATCSISRPHSAASPTWRAVRQSRKQSPPGSTDTWRQFLSKGRKNKRKGNEEMATQMTITGSGTQWAVLDNSNPANPRRVCAIYSSQSDAQRSLLNAADIIQMDVYGVPFASLSSIQTV